MQAYGETIFDIVYLLLATILGTYILIKHKNKSELLMGIATLILVLGDAFHLVPRMLNYFIDNDFNFYLGLGKLITSITMTIFYIFMYYIYFQVFNKKENNKLTITIWFLAIIRLILCLFPQNKWLTNENSYVFGIIRNIPFLFLGILIIILYFKERKNDKIFKNIWLYITLSFVFYMVVVLGASEIPILGMFMLPKTICYILVILSFKKKICN